MIMEKAAKQQICSKLCSNFATFLLIILVLALFSFFFFFSISESSPFLLTILIALLSTTFLVTLTKKKVSLDENLVQDKLQKAELQPSLGDVTQTEVTQQSETAQGHELQAESQSDSSFPLDSESNNSSIMDKIFELNAQKHEHQADPQSDSSLPSDSESSTGSIMGDIFEVDHYRNQNLGISDSLASDNDDEEEEEEEEDSLIEIKLPSSHFSGLTEESKQTLESKLPEFLPESIFKHQDVMELLAEINEMNEDENLIEIDISMGSTKCHDMILKQDLAYLGDQCVLSD